MLSEYYSERISIFNYNCPMFTGFGCAKDHVKKTGRLCGHGGIKGGIFEKSGVECMYLCEEKEVCRSYVYSPNVRHCKLQRESVPQNYCPKYNKEYKDFVWCSRKCNKGAFIFVYKIRFFITLVGDFYCRHIKLLVSFSLQESVQQQTASHANSHSFTRT